VLTITGAGVTGTNAAEGGVANVICTKAGANPVAQFEIYLAATKVHSGANVALLTYAIPAMADTNKGEYSCFACTTTACATTTDKSAVSNKITLAFVGKYPVISPCYPSDIYTDVPKKEYPLLISNFDILIHHQNEEIFNGVLVAESRIDHIIIDYLL
jgi:hypothetical protein